jgi:phosphoglycolate phosphatase
VRPAAGGGSRARSSLQPGRAGPSAGPVAVVFDLDGTLIDSRDDLTAAVNHVLRSFDLPQLSSEVVVGYVGEGARRLVQRALGAAHGDRLDDGLQRFVAYYGAHLVDRTQPYPGVPEMLTALAARDVTLAVLSNKPEAMSRAILDGLGLASHFVAVLGGDSLPTRKPDPAGVQYLCRLTGTPPERVLLVGDSLVDLCTAAAAGTAFCGVAWGFAPDALRAAAPQRIIDHPQELLAVMAQPLVSVQPLR